MRSLSLLLSVCVESPKRRIIKFLKYLHHNLVSRARAALAERGSGPYTSCPNDLVSVSLAASATDLIPIRAPYRFFFTFYVAGRAPLSSVEVCGFFRWRPGEIIDGMLEFRGQSGCIV